MKTTCRTAIASALSVLLFVGIASAFTRESFAQTQPPQQVIRRPDGGTSGAMESIFVPPKAGAPFSFTLVTEWTRPLGNGGSFTLVNERHIVRDSKGRINQERAALVPKNGTVKSFVTTIQITDPEQHTWYNCFPQAKVCDLYRYSLSATDTFVPAVNGNTTYPGGSTQHEDLGVSSTLGEDTHGYRETRTINPGVTGNDQPMVSVREFWYSPHLALNLISIVDNPLSGHQVFTAKDLSTSEPDPGLFDVPAGYKIVNHLSDPD
jgi:hypothetical protein